MVVLFPLGKSSLEKEAAESSISRKKSRLYGVSYYRRHCAARMADRAF